MSLPLLFLPGMMCDARMFGPQVAALRDDRAVSVADISGHDTMAALAADVLANAPQQFALAGLSMGGIVAMEMLRQAPDRVAQLALLDTNPLAESETVKTRRAVQIKGAQEGQLEAIMRDEMKPNYLVDGPNRQAILDLCMDMALSLGSDAFIRQSIALRDRPDQSATLQAYQARASHGPTLILCGRDDTLCPVSRHELMHSLMPGSQLTIIERAGHLPTLEQPDATTRALQRWLKEDQDG